jgi:hypothetical protein
MLLLIFSRHAFHPTTSSDTLSPASQPKRNGEEKVEE